MKSRIDRSCGARSQKTSTSGWTRPRLIRTESTKRMSPSCALGDQLADLQHRRACSSTCGRSSGPGPARRPRPTIVRRAAPRSASGFSTSTCLPASSAASAIGAWVRAGVAIATASMSSRASRSLDRRHRPRRSSGPDDLAGPVGVEVADGDQVPVRAGPEVADEVRAPVARRPPRPRAAGRSCHAPHVSVGSSVTNPRGHVRRYRTFSPRDDGVNTRTAAPRRPSTTRGRRSRRTTPDGHGPVRSGLAGGTNTTSTK